LNNKKNFTSIIILNYNGTKFLQDCINSIIRETNSPYEIIVVDNNSPDKSGELFSKKFPEITFILNKDNVGVPEGLNIGIRNASGDFIVLLNNDLIVMPNWLENFFKAYDKTGDALYQPKSLKFKDPSILDGTGCMINIFGFGFARDKGIKDEGKYTEQEEISYASGTCMFAPKKIFDEIGYFDSTFFAYHEELDLGWRARIFGYRSYYVPKTIIHHHGSAHWKWSPQVFYLLERNRWLVLLKNYSLPTLLKLWPSLIIIEFSMLGFFATKGLLLKKFKSYGSILGLFGHIIRQRKIIHDKRKTSDIEIMRSFCGTIKIPAEANNSKLNNKFEKLLTSLCKFSGYDKIVREP
jgi:GT2 family glycosyltransferase